MNIEAVGCPGATTAMVLTLIALTPSVHPWATRIQLQSPPSWSPTSSSTNSLASLYLPCPAPLTTVLPPSHTPDPSPPTCHLPNHSHSPPRIAARTSASQRPSACCARRTRTATAASAARSFTTCCATMWPLTACPCTTAACPPPPPAAAQRRCRCEACRILQQHRGGADVRPAASCSSTQAVQV